MVDMKSYDGENADITKDIIACAIEVHKTLGGPGILEKVYQHFSPRSRVSAFCL